MEPLAGVAADARWPIVGRLVVPWLVWLMVPPSFEGRLVVPSACMAGGAKRPTGERLEVPYARLADDARPNDQVWGITAGLGIYPALDR